jgi:hypothetical protein
MLLLLQDDDLLKAALTGRSSRPHNGSTTSHPACGGSTASPTASDSWRADPWDGEKEHHFQLPKLPSLSTISAWVLGMIALAGGALTMGGLWILLLLVVAR